jgi:hypothetical protein
MSNFNPLAKILITAGLILVVLGILTALGQRLPGLGKLPGDIYVTRKGFSFYFPLTTCIILSIIISLMFFFFTRK